MAPTAHLDRDRCPMCGSQAISICQCVRGHRSCAQGHHWHTCVVHQRVVIGPEDHSGPMLGCSCRPVGEAGEAKGG